MAKEAVSAKLYGKGPKIEPEGDGDLVKTDGGAPEKAAEEAAKSTGAKADMTHGGNAKEDVMAGTDGIPTHHHTQHNERESLHHKHQMELANLHHRHQHEHTMRAHGHHEEKMSAMHERHHEERRKLHTAHERELRDTHERHEGMREGPTGGMREKPEGKGGTETRT